MREAFRPFGTRIRFAGVLAPDVLKQLYRAADLYLWPAVKEAFGMALLEAQAAGLPVVAGRSGGVSSIVADGMTGLLVPEGDATAFSDAVASLLEDPARRSADGAGGDASMRRSENDIAGAAAFLDEQLRRLVGGGMIPLLVVRHGPTDWNEAKLIQGRTDRPLSEAARQQMSRLQLPAEWRQARCLASPLRRAMETATLLGLDPRPEAATDRDGVGRVGGQETLAAARGTRRGDARRTRHAGSISVRPNGESPRDVQTRLRPLLAGLGERTDLRHAQGGAACALRTRDRLDDGGQAAAETARSPCACLCGRERRHAVRGRS